MRRYNLDRLENINGTIVRTVYAVREFEKKENKEFLCYMQTENNMNFCRNIYRTYLNRIYVAEPFYKNGYGQVTEVEEWGETSDFCDWVIPVPLKVYQAQKKDYETVYEKYPEFKNIVKILSKEHKDVSNCLLITSLIFWKRYGEDFIKILKTKNEIIAFDEKYYSLERKEQDKVLTFVKKHKQTSRKLCQIKILMKLKEKYPEYDVDFLHVINYDSWSWRSSKISREDKLDFFHQTEEWKKLNDERKKEFDRLYLDPKAIRQEITYPKFKSLVKKARKYTLDSLYDLYLWQYHYNNTKWYGQFLARYNKDFIYTLQKAEKNRYYMPNDKDVDNLFTMWKKHGYETEMLIGCGLERFVLDEEYYELPDETRNAIKSFIVKNRNFIAKFHVRLDKTDIQELMKVKAESHEELCYIYENWHYVKNLAIDQIRYLIKNPKIEADEYTSYCKTVIAVGHDITDSYWRTPKQFKARHKKVLEEEKNIEKYFDEHKGQIYADYIKRYTQNISKTFIDGMEIFIPQNIDIIRSQAEMLNQCLIRMDYPKKVIKGNCVIVLVYKDKLPYATCEIADDRIVQFRGKDNCPMGNSEFSVMNRWLSANNKFLKAAA